MQSIIDRVRREPALVSGLVTAVLALAVSFGLDLTEEQVGSILAVVATVMALVVRQQVTPTSDGSDDDEARHGS